MAPFLPGLHGYRQVKPGPICASSSASEDAELGGAEAAEKLADILQQALTPEQQEKLVQKLLASKEVGPEALMAALASVQETTPRGSPGDQRRVPREAPNNGKSEGPPASPRAAAGEPVSADGSGGPAQSLGAGSLEEGRATAGDQGTAEVGGSAVRGTDPKKGREGKEVRPDEEGEGGEGSAAWWAANSVAARHEDNYGYYDAGDSGPGTELDSDALDGAQRAPKWKCSLRHLPYMVHPMLYICCWDLTG